MNNFTKIRLIIKEYLKQIVTIIIFFVALICVGKIISLFFKDNAILSKPIINKNNTKSVISSNKNPSAKEYDKTQIITDEFIKSCNSYDFKKAYTYLSSSNKEYFVTYNNFEKYIKKIFNEQKRYELRAYSNIKDIDIYQLRLFSDILATGLTKQKFNYLDLKIATKLDKNEPNGIMFNIGGFIKEDKLNDVFENDDIRIDFKKSKILYKSEIIEAEIQNKTNEIMVLKDFNSKIAEITSQIGTEIRSDLRKTNIIIKPYSKEKIYIEFLKFADDGKKINNIKLNDIRFTNEYKEAKSEEDEMKYNKRYTLDIKIRQNKK